MAENLETKVAVLGAEVVKMSELFGKLDTTIDRMTDISSSINQMLAVHEQKIAANAEDTEDLFHLIEKRRMENDENLKELHSRITTGSREMSQEMNANVIKIMHSIDELKNMMIAREKDVRGDQAELETRINDLEKKQFLVAGMAAAFGFIAGAFDWIAQLFN